MLRKISGGISATVDQHYPASEIADDLQLVQAKLVITDEQTRDKALKAAAMSNVPYGVVTFQELDKMLQDDIHLAEPVHYTPEQLVKTPAYIYFTSGTTGRKKGAIHTQRTMTAAMQYMTEFIPDGSRGLTYTEFHHISQLIFPCHPAIQHGITCYIMNTRPEPMEPRRICEAIQMFKIDTMVTQPFVLNVLAKEAWVSAFDLSTLKYAFCGGAAPDGKILDTVYQRFGVKFVNHYGMTESMVMMAPSWESSRAGTMTVR